MSDTAVRTVELIGSHGSFVLTNREDALPRLWLTGLDGWFGGVGVSADDTQRTLGHGLFPEISVRTGRVLTLRGRLIFSDDTSRLVADRFISGILGSGEYGELRVTTADLTLSSYVRLDGEVKHSYVKKNTREAEVEIPLLASDPFLYAPARMVQVYPSGAGVGLRYPFFSGSYQNVASLIPGLTSGDATPAGLPGVRFTSNNPASVQVVNMAPVTAGKTYAVTGWAKADRPGSNFTIRYVITGPGKTDQSGYIIANPVTRPVTTEWTSYSANLPIPEGYTGISLTVYPNHSAGTVYNAVVDVAVSVSWLDSGPLSFGKANPNTRAVIENQGNATSYPVIRLVGDFPSGFILRDSSGKTIEYPSPVWQRSPVEVDNKAGAVYQDGIDQSYRLTRRQWFSIPAGGVNAFTVTSIQPGDGRAEIVHRNTYI